MDPTVLYVPVAVPLLGQLQEALILESKYQPNLRLPSKPPIVGVFAYDGDGSEELTLEHRDASAYVLRSLKVWFELPSEVLFNAINLMDRFIDKMNARKKHIACISVAAFHIATVEMARKELDVDTLVAISSCKCTSRDVRRMEGVIRNKLEWNPATQPVTALTFLRIYYLMLQHIAVHIGLEKLFADHIQESELLVYMENVVCDNSCASMNQSEVALVLIFTFINDVVKNLLEAAGKGSNAMEEENFEMVQGGPTELLKLNDFLDYFKEICKVIYNS